MAACPSCGQENPDGFKFCGFCTASMAAEPSNEAEERKVVSVLFCDLVGFTSASEHADPEDVRAGLRPYHSLLRSEIEAYGGTVEKFIGDAVMAVFGAPIAHEDDAERAVRAALRILESLEDLNEERGLDLTVRVGINTGEAVVALGARPELGEGIVTGDVVNTAARIQTGGPVGGVAVGATTYASTKDVFDYEELEPIVGKGKSVPIAAWRALVARARFGSDITRRHDTALVGRDSERTLLGALLDKSIRDASCQLVTITGEPGVGKSRLVYELQEIAQGRSELITWRQGRCLPYGEGITFWALGEIVKAEAGILDSDPPEQAATKLDRALGAHGFPTGEFDWLRARLAPLVGVEAASSGEREESFTAWRRFLEGIAGSGPAVFVFEDLHWADAAMLEFLEHLADWSEGSPMLVICTARPELIEQRAGWSRGLRNASMVGVTPLSQQDIAHLIAGLLEQSVLPVEIQVPIVERSGGNPLYAEEFIRMLKDRGLLVRAGGSWTLAEGAEIPFPENVQGLIAARLDTLSPEHKSLLQDAAVLGKVFWAGALCAIGSREEGAVEGALHELTRKEFIRSARSSSMEGERESNFWHMLVRDVAYGQIPRAQRASKHVLAAEWIEAHAGDRAEDVADVLAYHYVEALDLTTAIGGDTADLAERTLKFLVLSAQRTANLDPIRSAEMYERALELAPADHPDRAMIQFQRAEVLRVLNRFDEAEPLLDAAIEALNGSGQRSRAAVATLSLANTKSRSSATGDGRALIVSALAMLEELAPSRDLVHGYSEMANSKLMEGSDHEAMEWANKALELAEELGLPAYPRALTIRGSARATDGDPEGIIDLRRSIVVAGQRGELRTASMAHNNLATVLALSAGPTEALSTLQAGMDLARSGGYEAVAFDMEALTRPDLLYDLGRWDEISDIADRALRVDSTADWGARTSCTILAADVAICRGQQDSVSGSVRDLADEVMESGEAQSITSGLCVTAHHLLAVGKVAEAGQMLRRLEAFPTVRGSWNYPGYLPELVRLSLAAVGLAFAEDLVRGLPDLPLEAHRVCVTMAEAELAEARGDLEGAALGYAIAEEGWRTFSVPELAQALLGRGRCLLAMDDPGAEPILREAREVFASLEARRFIPEVDALLERAVRLTS